MGEVAVAVLIGAWVVQALVLGYVMGRRGFDAYTWTLIGISLGPIAVGVALFVTSHPTSREPRVLRVGRRGTGAIDVVVGVDGSPESNAAIDRVASLFGTSCGRVTLARVVPIDAVPEVERMAETQLSSACASHPDLGAGAVVLRGEPVAALRDYVMQFGYEVLVVGTRGAGKTHAVLGSVATSVARGAGIPVLLVDDTPVQAHSSVSTPETAPASARS